MSYKNTINIFLDDKRLRKQIMSIQTDSSKAGHAAGLLLVPDSSTVSKSVGAGPPLAPPPPR